MATGRWLRRIGIAIVALVALLFALVAAALMLVNTDALKGVIAERVEDATGRALVIEGPLEVSLFPWLGFELGATRLANAEGFGEQPFAALERAELRVRLLPLLRREVALDTVVLHGLELNLARNARGAGNWADLAGAPAAPGPAADGAAGEPGPAAPAAGLAGVSLRAGGIELADARLDWRDATTGQAFSVRDLDLETGPLEANTPTPVRLSVALEPEGGPTVELGATASLTFDPGARTAALAGLVLDVEAAGDAIPGGALAASLGADIRVDAGAGRATVEPLELTLEDTRVTGSLRATLDDVPNLGFELEADAIDLDRYLPADGPPPVAAATGGEGGDGGDGADPIASLPLQAMRGVELEGHVKVGRLGYRGLDLTDLGLDLRLADGLLTLERADLKVAGGTLRTRGRLDARTDTPALRLETDIGGVRAEPFLTAFTGAAPVVGRLDTTLALDTAGGTLDAWLGALDGRLAATFTEGAIEGINLAQQLRGAAARLRGGSVDEATATRRTDFSTLRFAGDIRDGVLHANELDLRAPLLRVRGDGRFDLARRELDYTARVLLTGTLEGEGGAAAEQLRGLEVPIRFRGPFADPSIDVQLAKALEGRETAAARARKEAAEAEAERAVEEEKRRLEQQRREAEERAKQKLRDGLKGLFE